MADTPERRPAPPATSWFPFVVLISLALGNFLTKPPLESERPADGYESRTNPSKTQTYPEAITGDPMKPLLECTLRETVSKTTPSVTLDLVKGTTVTSSVKSFKETIDTKRNVLLLPVIVNAGYSSVDCERRLRTRYAVVSGLARAGFVPFESQNLGITSLPIPVGAQPLTNDPASRPESLPAGVAQVERQTNPLTDSKHLMMTFERFGPDFEKGIGSEEHPSADDNRPNVLVVWLGYDALHDRRLDTVFATMLGALEEKISKHNDDTKTHANRRSLTKASIAAIGTDPTIRILENLSNGWEGPRLRGRECPCKDFKVYLVRASAPTVNIVRSAQRRSGKEDPLGWDYWAKGPSQDAPPSESAHESRCESCQRDDFLTRGNGDYHVCETVFQPAANKDRAGIRFVRTLCDDVVLLELLEKELTARGRSVDHEDGKNVLLLIGEWDTSYSRAMKQRFVETHPAHPKRILSISYARGVDESPSGETSAKASRSTPDTGDKSKDLGETQMDYIRRAQSEMAKVNQELVAQDRRVTAVGILGTDIYDKMVILQAVKPIFPKAVVFTTDLDATHSDSSQYKRNRNLLVAGTYGLALHPELQGSIPPFREGLQTSTFFATLEAVGFDVAETMRPHVNVPSGAKLVPGFVPRIFEIGWSGPYDLTGHQGVSPEAPVVVNTSRKAMLGAKGEARIVDINPRSRRGRVVVAWIETHDWELAILIGGAFALTVFGSDKLKRKLWPTKPSPGAEAGSPAEAWIVIALTAFALLAIRWQLPGIARDGDGEPVEFFEGISVWPSIVLRGVLVVLAFVFWYRIARTRWRLPDANGQQRVPPSLHDAFKASFNALRRWTWGRDGARASGFRNAWKIVQGNGVKRTCEGMWTSWQTMWLSRWNSLPVNDGDSEAVYAELEKRLDWRWLSLRMVAVVAGLIVVFFLVNVPYPEAPARGFARHLDRDLSFASWSAVIAIAILVNRVVRTVRRFAELKLKDYRDKFTALSIEQAGAFSTRCLRDCQRLRDISKAALDNLYPASILVCILILCYNPYFDAWHWSLVLPGAFLFVSIVVISNAWSLGRTIQRVRTEIVERLRNVAEEGATKDVKDIICARSDRILALDGGAFTRFVDMPLVRAIMIPVSGAGGISLIQYLTPFLS